MTSKTFALNRPFKGPAAALALFAVAALGVGLAACGAKDDKAGAGPGAGKLGGASSGEVQSGAGAPGGAKSAAGAADAADGASTAARVPHEGPPRVSLIMKSLANEFFKTMEDGARAHQAAHAADYALLANGIKNEEDVAAQIGLVEQAMAQGADAIVIAPADSKALVPVLKRALKAGLVVVNIDNKLDATVLMVEEIRIPFVGPDNREGARMAAAYLAGKLAPGDPVAIIEGIPTAFNGVERKAGFEAAMAAGGMKIVASQSGQWESDKANAVAAGMLTEHPEIKALLCANDSMALGAAAAARSAGRADKILIIGYDGISAVRDLIREGRILCTVEQHGDRLAVFGIEAALESLRTGGATASDRQTPVELVTAETLATPAGEAAPNAAPASAPAKAPANAPAAAPTAAPK